MKSRQAQAAAMIRAELKKHGVKASVRSSSASMMTEVTVRLKDPAPWVRDAVEAYVGQFEYGSFNPMIDLYEYDKSRDDIPQVKYTMVESDFSDDLTELAEEYLRERHAELLHDEGNPYAWEQGVRAVLYGSKAAYNDPFWVKPRKRLEAAA